jgi:small subunit ribosomal protein S17
MVSTENKKTQRVFRGEVVSTGMNKTIVAVVSTMKRHSKYNKAYRVSRKYHIHDEKGEAKVGNIVDFTECRPLSATKRWRLTAVVKAAK